MTEARTSILNAIRNALHRARTGQDFQLWQGRAAASQAGLLLKPAVEGDCVAHFTRRITATGATLVRLTSVDAIPSAVRTFLDDHGLEHTLVRAALPALDALPWLPDLEVSVRPAMAADRTSLTGVLAAIAETGSLVVASARHSPNTLHFLPENHIALVQTSQVLRHLEDVWQRVRERPGGMPRALTFITGPSRTGDVEQTIQIGAHGPRRLHVILVEA